MIRPVLQGLTVLLFISSVAFSAFKSGESVIIGLAALIYGTLTVGEWSCCSWLANPLLIATFLLMWNGGRLARRAAIFTILLIRPRQGRLLMKQPNRRLEDDDE